jgi:hypothetical protein
MDSTNRPLRRKSKLRLAPKGQRVCMKGFSQFGVLAGDEAQGFGQVVFAHVGLKVGE